MACLVITQGSCMKPRLGTTWQTSHTRQRILTWREVKQLGRGSPTTSWVLTCAPLFPEDAIRAVGDGARTCSLVLRLREFLMSGHLLYEWKWWVAETKLWLIAHEFPLINEDLTGWAHLMELLTGKATNSGKVTSTPRLRVMFH